jgi:hypothetical protein
VHDRIGVALKPVKEAIHDRESFQEKKRAADNEQTLEKRSIALISLIRTPGVT